MRVRGGDGGGVAPNEAQRERVQRDPPPLERHLGRCARRAAPPRRRRVSAAMLRCRLTSRTIRGSTTPSRSSSWDHHRRFVLAASRLCPKTTDVASRTKRKIGAAAHFLAASPRAGHCAPWAASSPPEPPALRGGRAAGCRRARSRCRSRRLASPSPSRRHVEAGVRRPRDPTGGVHTVADPAFGSGGRGRRGPPDADRATPPRSSEAAASTRRAAGAAGETSGSAPPGTATMEAAAACWCDCRVGSQSRRRTVAVATGDIMRALSGFVEARGTRRFVHGVAHRRAAASRRPRVASPPRADGLQAEHGVGRQLLRVTFPPNRRSRRARVRRAAGVGVACARPPRRPAALAARPRRDERCPSSAARAASLAPVAHRTAARAAPASHPCSQVPPAVPSRTSERRRRRGSPARASHRRRAPYRRARFPVVASSGALGDGRGRRSICAAARALAPRRLRSKRVEEGPTGGRTGVASKCRARARPHFNSDSRRRLRRVGRRARSTWRRASVDVMPYTGT